MELRDQNILFLVRTMSLGGTENVVVQMCKILKPYVGKIVVCSTGGVNEKILENLDIKHVTIGDFTDKRNLLRNLVKISNLIKQENITIIHGHHRMAAAYAQILGVFHRVDKVCTAHGVFFDKKRLTKFAYKNTRIIACGRTVKENLVNEFGIDSSMTEVISNSVIKDASKTHPIAEIEETRKNGFFCIGYVGRLSKEKGVNFLIESFVTVSKKIPARLFIAGDGPCLGELKQLIEERKLTEQVTFLGYRSDAQNVIRQLDLLVLSSLTEGLPLTPIESFANGIPVVATSAGGTVDVVKDRYNGRLVPVMDVDKMSDAILDTLLNREDYKLYQEHGISDFENNYSYDVFSKKLISFYKKL